VSLVSFHTKDQVKTDQNLFNEQVMPGVEKEKELDTIWYPYLKPAVSAYLVYDDTWYLSDMSNVSPFIFNHLAMEATYGIYLPITYPSDFWVLKKHLTLMDANFTTDNATVTLSMGTLYHKYFQYQRQFESSCK